MDNESRTYYDTWDVALYGMSVGFEEYVRLNTCFLSVLRDVVNGMKRIGVLRHRPRILDVGSGFGYFLKMLLDNGFDASGVEIDSFAIESDKSVYSQIPAEVAKRCDILDISSVLNNGEKFDIVTCFHVLEQYDDDDVNKIMSELASVTNNAARLMVCGLSSEPFCNVSSMRICKHRSPDDWISVLSCCDNVSVEKVLGVSRVNDVSYIECTLHGVVDNNDKTKLGAIKI